MRERGSCINIWMKDIIITIRLRIPYEWYRQIERRPSENSNRPSKFLHGKI